MTDVVIGMTIFIVLTMLGWGVTLYLYFRDAPPRRTTPDRKGYTNTMWSETFEVKTKITGEYDQAAVRKIMKDLEQELDMMVAKAEQKRKESGNK